MKIGFIGAGRVGVTLGRYFDAQKKSMKNYDIIGYYDISESALKEAIILTKTKRFTLEEIVINSDILFITVVDGAIKDVWNQIKDFNLEEKIVCHCSGAISSEVFSNISFSLVSPDFPDLLSANAFQ